MIHYNINLEQGKKVYFASDFHLGAPAGIESKKREQKIVNWLNSIKADAQEIFLVGDIFDFWFEYKYTIPKGFIRLQGKLAELIDNGIKIHFFTGNHDMWMFNYFEEELGITIYRKPINLTINNSNIFLGHGDGLGPGDLKYKFLKKIFSNKVCQWLFARLHPNLSFYIANTWSKSSRAQNADSDEKFLGDNEWLLQYCKEVLKEKHYDFFVFGHRHLALDIAITEKSRYVNLGEWFKICSYAIHDGKNISLEKYHE
jgi:UDP-2,3-diacylglucosamine hydrolase